MSVRRLGVSVAVFVAALTGPANAQRADSVARRADSVTQRPRTDTTGALACPRGGGLMRWWMGPAGDSTRRSRAGAVASSAPSARRLIDTVVTLNITDHTWQRDSVTAGVALGATGSAGARRAPWQACAGATATFGRVTATLRNVHGQIHLRADPRALDAIGGTTGRTTPPAPPRR